MTREPLGMVELGNYVKFVKGFAFKSKWYTNEGMPIIKVSNFSEDSINISDLTFIPKELGNQYLKHQLRTGDVVIQTVGSWPSNPQSVVGKVIRVPSFLKQSLLNQNAARIVPAEGLDNSFLYYLLRENRFKDYIIGTAQGAASQASITLESIKKFQFLLPPLDSQRKISIALSCFDSLIENNIRRIRMLEEMAQLIYREWFVKFHFPGHEKVKMVDSPLGKIPEGWKLYRIGDKVELAYGKALKTSDRIQGEVPVFGSSGVVGWHQNKLVDGPGIIVGRKGNVGSVHWSDTAFYPIDTVFYVKTDVSLPYLYYNFQTQNFINTDAAVPGLNRNQAYSLPLLIPSTKMLGKFDDFCASLFKQVRLYKEKNEVLRKTRDLLLPKLISGQLDVSDLNIDIGESAA